MAVGELFLSAFIKVLFTRLASRELLDYARQLKGGVFKELEKLEKTLNLIQHLLNDAEESQLTKRAVKTWLDDLQDLAYDVEDILDEFAYEVLQRKLVAEHQTTSSKVLNCIPSSYTSLRFKHHLVSNIKEITKRLEELYGQRSGLGLQVLALGTSSTVAPAPQRPTSVPTEPAFIGREEDKAKILAIVLSDEPSNANFRVISIVGMGGIGKTALAREVYKAVDYIKFEIKAWACVSDDFDILRISKVLLESITSSFNSPNDLNEVQVQLTKAVSGKKFLLVLDDVWNKRYSSWEELKAPFMTCAPGSKFIVTTRNKDVALIMGSPEPHYLKRLSDEDCWSLFLMHAVIDNTDISTQQCPEFIRKRVVDKCKGLPLAAKTLGSLLRTKPRVDDWADVLESKIWQLTEDNDSDIFRVLKVSYYHLPSNLKRCFVYCAIFPKDYEFQEKELVLLWIAEGFVHEPSTNSEQLEDLGGDYFYELFSRSFFQRSSSNNSKFVMHDLIHDLAQSISGDSSFTTEDRQPTRLEKVRHASYSCDNYNSEKKFEVLGKFEHLRTLLSVDIWYENHRYVPQIVLDDFMEKFKKLRVLTLKGLHITQLPKSIRVLKHLRYLNLSNTMIRALPESICSLVNLQILLLEDCPRLIKLPSQMKNLINLRCLDISGRNSLTEMPMGMNELKNLQMLSNFIAGKGDGSKLKDLKSLKLRGEFCISGLENILESEATNEKILRHHNQMKVLSLLWHSQFEGSRNEIVEEKVLAMLQPNKNIEELTIKYYGGTKFPSWLEDSSFSKMVVLNLKGCRRCEKLPPLGLLGSLKTLFINGMAGLKYLGSEIYGKDCLKPFQSLETLNFDNLQEWEWWEPVKENEHVERFPCLRKLYITRCPKLAGKLPDYLPLLEKLVIINCPQLVVSCSNLPALYKLKIDECKGIMCCGSPTVWKSLRFVTLAKVPEIENWSKLCSANVRFLKIDDCEELIHSWPLQGRHSLISLRELDVANCASLDSFPEANFLPNLRRLTFRNCNALKSLPEKMKENNECLERLTIIGCDSLTFIWRGTLPSSLRGLSIRNCKNLQFLVDDKDDACASSTSSSASVMRQENFNISQLELYIVNCPSLTCISARGQLSISIGTLYIERCPKLESVTERFDNSMRITHVSVRKNEKLKFIPCNNTTSSVDIFGCKELEVLPDCMNNLDFLLIMESPSVRSFPNEGLSTNLISLTLDGDQKIYKPLIEWGLHNLTCLKHLRIHNCLDAVSFPHEEMDMILPTSLSRLCLLNFPKLKYLSSRGFQSLTSLESLDISKCPKLRSFPKVGLPSSLLRLDLVDCPLLKKGCRRNKGKEWPKIAHITCVYIDNKFIYDSAKEDDKFNYLEGEDEEIFYYSYDES